MIYVAVLLLGACGSASRTVVVEPTIAAIVWRVAMGGARDVVGSGSSSAAGFAKFDISQIVLSVNGAKASGAIAWLIAGAKVAGFVTDAWRSGSIEWDYHVCIRGLSVWRRTEIRDGYVRLTTDIFGSMGPRGELYRVKCTITATALRGGTEVTGTATGWTAIGRRSRLVARIAGREVSRGMQRELLSVVEAGAYRLYQTGDLHETVDLFIAKMR